MPKQCAVINCKSSYKKTNGIQLFHFPLKDETRCNLWIEAIGREDWHPTKHSVVCSHHFKPQDYLHRPNACKQYLRPDAVPSLSLALTARTIPISHKSNKPKFEQVYVNENIQVKTEILTDLVEIKQDEITEDNQLQIENTIKLEPETKELKTENELLDNNHTEPNRGSYVPSLILISPCITQQKNNLSDKSTQTETIENTKTEPGTHKKIRCLQQKIRRQTKKINSMTEILNELKSKGVI